LPGLARANEIISEELRRLPDFTGGEKAEGIDTIRRVGEPIDRKVKWATDLSDFPSLGLRMPGGSRGSSRKDFLVLVGNADAINLEIAVTTLK